jgi:hypothetical protein
MRYPELFPENNPIVEISLQMILAIEIPVTPNQGNSVSMENS